MGLFLYVIMGWKGRPFICLKDYIWRIHNWSGSSSALLLSDHLVAISN
jgi:hypothetical protein